jgi:hypothetical protein
VSTETLTDWLRSLNLDELRDFRFELYDRAEIAPKGSDVYEFARAAVRVVCVLELRLEAREELRSLLAAAVPDVDADVFADALVALNAAQRQLDSAPNVVETFNAALEVAQRRAETMKGETDGN